MDYFQLEMDLVKLYATWGETDLVFAGEEQRAGVLSGVRVLRQDPWECLFGFICSSNNHITRISSMVSHPNEAVLMHAHPWRLTDEMYICLPLPFSGPVSRQALFSSPPYIRSSPT